MKKSYKQETLVAVLTTFFTKPVQNDYMYIEENDRKKAKPANFGREHADYALLRAHTLRLIFRRNGKRDVFTRPAGLETTTEHR